MTDVRSGRHPVDELAEEFVARYRAGERPSISEYAGKYPQLAGELQELLGALVLIEEHGPQEALPLSGSAGGCPATGVRIPSQLGEYRILREIGRGGMGFVYEAVQESLGRHVALKVLPVASLIDPLRLKRFQREVHAAARLHHSNIVPVFGVGECDGISYYAMQFIEGQSLQAVLEELQRMSAPEHETVAALADDTAAANSSSMRGLASDIASAGNAKQRYYRSIAQIGMQVADALAYAHQQRIEHRDIKPSNLLLDSQGTVWVTDFGLARCEGTEELTRAGDVVGTLRYLAPERLQGSGDARADVYSLGLTLYELLTLRPAFAAKDRAALVRQIAHDDPPRPRQLDPRIPRDLETIVLKACAKEPARRYSTAEELAEDLRRFLGDRPIEARRIAYWEHAWRWCRRNPGLATAILTAASALLIGLSVSLWQWRRADHNRRQAESSAVQAGKDFNLALQAIERMLERVGADRLEVVPHMDRTRRALLQDAVRFYQDLLRDRQDSLKGRLAMARAYGRLGQIHGSLSDGPEAVNCFDQALALLHSSGPRDGNDINVRGLEARSYAYRGAAKDYLLHQRPEAEADYRQALAIWEQMAKERPDQTGFAGNRAHTLYLLGNLLQFSSRVEEGEACIRQSITIAEGLPAEHPYRTKCLANGNHLLSRLQDAQGDLAEAERTQLRALELYERSAQEDAHPIRQYELAGALKFAAYYQARSAATQPAAETLYLRSLKISERLSADFPDVPAYRHELAAVCGYYGVLLTQRGRPKDAQARFERAVALLKELVAKSFNAEYRVGLGGALHNLARELHDRGQLAEARAMLEEAIGCQETVVRIDPNQRDALPYLTNHHVELDSVLVKLGLTDEAEKLALQQQALAQELAAKDGQSSLVRAFQAQSCESLARLRQRTKQLDEAVQAWGEATEHWRRLVADFPDKPEFASKLGAALNDWAIVLHQQHRWEEMAALVDEAIEVQDAAVSAQPEDRTYQKFLCNHYLNRAEAQLGLGNYRHVAPAAAELRGRFPDLFDDYGWAVKLARCIPLIEKDPQLLQEDRDRLAREQADQTLALLQAAQQRKSKSLPHVHNNPAFRPLRSRKDFQQLLAEVARPAK